jgi:nicotinamide phosphoribosyltransferase
METLTLNRETRRLIERHLKKPVDNLMTKDEVIKHLEKALQSLEPNLILMGDAYKYSHHKFYTDGLTKMVSYLESRGGKFQETVMFGLQYIIKKYFTGEVLSAYMAEEAEEKLNGENGVFGKGGSFSKEKWMRLIEKHGGKLPIRIKAVPEGTVVPVKNVLMMIENTDDEFPWLVGFLETLLLQVWYPITVATLSREVKKVVVENLEKTGTAPELIPAVVQFVLNDFGFRGVSSVESASIGGAAHLVNFMGSDNIMGSDMLIKFYNTKIMYGKSIDATEHSIMTMKGEKGELEMMKRVLLKSPTGIVACVSDSFNIFRACAEYWGTELRDIILSRQGVLVIRPDSGDPVATLREVFRILFEKFGFTINTKGYKVLPPQVRVIQGDGVNYDSIKDMYRVLAEDGIAAENLVLGMGGKLLQAGLDRDTQNFAVKACYAIINGVGFDIVKSPTEMGADGKIKVSFKKSKKGLLKLVKTSDGGYYTMTSNEAGFAEAKCELVVIFENGELLVDENIEAIRKRAEVSYEFNVPVLA